MCLTWLSRRSVRRPNAGHNFTSDAPEAQPPPLATQFVLSSILTPQIPLVDTLEGFPPTPRIPLRELPALPAPQPLFRLHPALTANTTFQWGVRLDRKLTELAPWILHCPAFESPTDIQSFRLHFSPLASMPAMDYSCDVAVSRHVLPGTPITIDRVFRSIHRALHTRLEPAALPQGDPLRKHVEEAFYRRTGRPFNAQTDVLRNVDLHMVGRRSQGSGLYFNGIAVEDAQGPYGPYPVFRVLLKGYAQG